MAEVMATVPTAAQAVRRKKARRLISEYLVLFMDLFLDDEVRRTCDEMNHGADAITHLGIRGRRTESEIVRVGDVTHDGGLRAGRQLPGQQSVAKFVHKAWDCGVCRVTAGHPRIEIQDDGADVPAKAAQAIRVARVVQNAAFEKIEFHSDTTVGRELKFGRGHPRRGQHAGELVARIKEIEDSW
jgi:hypothetical protein